MSVSRTKLATHNGVLAKKLEALLEEARKLGVNAGMQRILLVCEQYDKLSPDVAYAFIDLLSLQQEIEEAFLRSWKLEAARIIRNVLSLAPLIATWFALFFAVSKYQTNLVTHPGDLQVPFLQQWQDGFHHVSGFTFTVAALLDVILLSCYLLSILVTQQLERRAQVVAVNFTNRLHEAVEELIGIISAASFGPISGPQDVDKVAKAIKIVIDQALQQTDKLTQAAQQAIEESNKRAEDLFTTQIVPLVQNFDTDSKNFGTNLAGFQTNLNDLSVHVQQLASDSAALVKQAQDYINLGKNIDASVGKLDTTQQGLISQLSGLSGNVTTAINSVQTAVSGMTGASASVKDAAAHLDSGIQMTTTKMADSVDRATAFQGELVRFQQKLDQMNDATQDLTDASISLVGDVKTVGSEINKLQLTQQHVSTQLSSIVGNVANAANNMAAATNRIESAATSLETIAQGLNVGVQQTVNQMTSNINRATSSLMQVENSLEHLSRVLAQAANQLASPSSGTSRGGGGFVGWLFQRGSHRGSRGGPRP